MAMFIFRRSLLNGNFKLICRLSSSQPCLKLNVQVEEDLINEKIKPRQHSGIFNRGGIQLPIELREAVGKIIIDLPQTNLV